ncbi:polymer-forming cytoskeletal protein [Cohnella endophytica]|uniref:Polymer-forming cytoskeletal protein n=1 Tax=Cohnella endophytica TaxID=2419778 RepID=A0A494X1T9_9BACL|nr:polymer-forming cytoskeletal protein [Cohnella endophytica]RKP44290.1 polymer-forming cytoskeletal protein [Cohnella endophytica]
MFKKKTAKIDPNMTDTLIGEGTTFEGKIKSQAGIRVEGQLVGDMDCAGDITIGENGIARSNIKARNVIVAGQVIGNVSATGKLTIKNTGKLHGNLSALELSIESGAVFQGMSMMDVKDAPLIAPAPEEKIPNRESEINLPVTIDSDKDAVLKTW